MRGHCGQGLSAARASGRARQQLELVHRQRALAVGGAQAVGAGVAAADDDDPLARGGDDLILRNLVAFAAAVLLGEVFDGEMDASELAPRHRQVAGGSGAAAQHDGLEVPPQGRRRDVDAHVDAGAELDALRLEQRQPAVHHPLLDLELGNAVAEQTADAIGFLEDGDEMAGLVQLVRGRQSGRARSDHRHALAGPHRRRRGADPAFVERPLDDRQLDVLDRDRIVVDAEDAGALAGGRAQAAGEVREVVGRVQAIDRRLPAVAVDQIVPLRNLVAERTALMAERNAAIHAARALIADLFLGRREIDLVPVADPHVHRTRVRLGALDLDKTVGVTHWSPPPAPRTPARGSRIARAPRPAARACSRAG